MSRGKLLVTGGAGFIGSAFVIRAVREGFKVIVLDKLTYAGDLERIKEVQNQIKFFESDIADSRSLEEMFRQESPDAVVHLAAETHVDRSILRPREFVETNVIGTVNLLEASLKHQVRRFVHVSTDEVYGELAADKKLLFRETDPLRPNSPYSASKASADMFARAYSQTYGLPLVTARPSNNYGPWQYPEKLVPLAISEILSDGKVPVYGKGENVRTWLFVEDCVDAIFKVFENGRIGEIYNVGSDEERRNIDVVHQLLDLLGKSKGLVEFVTDRPAHDFRYALDTKKIREELGWKPAISFELGLEKTAGWYRQNKAWLLKKKSAAESQVKAVKESFAKMARER